MGLLYSLIKKGWSTPQKVVDISTLSEKNLDELLDIRHTRIQNADGFYHISIPSNRHAWELKDSDFIVESDSNYFERRQFMPEPRSLISQALEKRFYIDVDKWTPIVAQGVVNYALEWGCDDDALKKEEILVTEENGELWTACRVLADCNQEWLGEHLGATITIDETGSTATIKYVG